MRGGAGRASGSVVTSGRSAPTAPVAAPSQPTRTSSRVRTRRPDVVLYGWVPPPGQYDERGGGDTSRGELREPPQAREIDWFAFGGGVRATGPIGLARTQGATGFGGAPAGVPDYPIGTEELPPPAPSRRDQIRGAASLDGGYVLGDAGRITAGGRLDLPASFYVLFAYSGYAQPNGSGYDALALGRLGVGVRCVDEPDAELRLAIAARHFQDWIGPQFGVDALLGLELALEGPLVFGAELSLGTVGSAIAAEARATLGLRFGAIEVYAGYDHLALQPFDGSVGAVDLGGPIAGIRALLGP
jgi:hypothetical protein